MTKAQLLKALERVPDDAIVTIDGPFIHGTVIEALPNPQLIQVGYNHYGSADTPPTWYRQDKYPKIKQARPALFLDWKVPVL